MKDYAQTLREAALEATDGQPVQKRADALNLIETLISGELTPEQIVDRIATGDMPVYYVPAETEPKK